MHFLSGDKKDHYSEKDDTDLVTFLKTFEKRNRCESLKDFLYWIMMVAVNRKYILIVLTCIFIYVAI